jgi:hypothetical protein
MRYRMASVPLILGLAFIGCERSEEAEPPFTPASATGQSAERAVEGLASARCDYEQRCRNVGPTATFLNREHCLNVMRSDARDKFRDCRAGIKDQELRECLGELANEDCGGAGGTVDALERSIECRATEICFD